VSIIESRLAEVCRQEQLEVEPEALTMVARLADGSMRDAQTLLDRVQTFCSGKITADETSKALGSVARSALAHLAQMIVKRDVNQVLVAVAELFATGSDPATVLKEFANFWREVFIAKLGGEARLRSLGLGEDSIVDLLRIVAALEVVDVQDLWDLAREGADRCMRSAYPRYGFEALVVRMATRQPIQEIGEIIGQLSPTGGARAQTSLGAPRSVATTVTKPVTSQHSISQQSIPQQSIPQYSAHSTRESQSASSPSSSAGTLIWDNFLSFVAEKGGRILLENLKRLAVTRFEVGLLEATAPEFTITSINREKVKIQELFVAFACEVAGADRNQASAQWKVTLKKLSADSGAADTQKVQTTKIEELEAHPALQSLQKIFPGSKVEQVRVKSD
jgi:DNA polymerase-3 subunit gamma/tau